MAKKFQRNIENFECLNCGKQVIGDGYTNHCPHCLWSRHVDVNPGDRLETCQGPMKPIAIEKRQDTYRILHHCQTCHVERWNKSSQADNFESIIQLSSEMDHP
jgi:hypothetical protein